MSFWGQVGNSLSKVDWGQVAGTAAQIGGSIYTANQQNQQNQQATDAIINANNETAALNREIYYDTIARAQPDVVAGYDAKRLRMASYGMNTTDYDNAFKSVPAITQPSASGQGGDASTETPTDGVAYGSGDPYDQYKNTTNFYGGPSYIEKLDGHNPSIFSAAKNGSITEHDWWADGGPSVGASIIQGIGGRLGLPKPSELFGLDKKKIGQGDWADELKASGDQFGTFDVDSYFAANPDLLDDLKNNPLSERDATYMANSGADFDGNGLIDTKERYFNHYISHGKGEGRLLGLPEPEQPTQATQPEQPVQTSGSTLPATTQKDYNDLTTQMNPVITTATPTEPAPSTAIETTEPVNTTPDWQNAFKNSGDYIYGVQGFDRASTNQLGQDSALGISMSGAHDKAIADYSSQYAGNAYNNWDSRLAGISGEGNSGTNVINSAAQNYGYNTSGTNTASGNAFARYLSNKTNTTQAGINAGISAASNNGWL